MITAPYGEWDSPIAAADVASGEVSLSFPRLVPVAGGAPEVWWTEGRPTESGRQAVVRRTADGSIHDVLPMPWSARTRVHEYGGASWLVTAAGLVFAQFADAADPRAGRAGRVALRRPARGRAGRVVRA
jgi:hypothetical protein